MFILNPKNLNKLGEFIGQGNVNKVYSTPEDKYVYKVRKEGDRTIEGLLITAKHILHNRNYITFQLPFEFVGIMVDGKQYHPIFRQLKAEPITEEVELPYEEGIKDNRIENYGIYQGEIVAIDVYRSNLLKFDSSKLSKWLKK